MRRSFEELVEEAEAAPIDGWDFSARATALLHPPAAVVAVDEEPPLTFADDAFDLVSSHHPAAVHWDEIARVLAPGGTYLAQHVGGRTNVEVSEYFLGPGKGSDARDHEVEAERACAAGLARRCLAPVRGSQANQVTTWLTDSGP